MSTALAIFVKTPGHSPVKTRLAASIGSARAEQFHRLAAAAVAAVARAAIPVISPCWAVAEPAACSDPLWRELPVIGQGDGELGSRLDHVCRQLQERHGRVLLIGADAPQISVRLLHAAVAALDDPPTPYVLGCANDGGFWLFGTRRPVPAQVWLTPRYSSPSTADQLIDALAPAAIAYLPTLVDVDDGADLSSLVSALNALERPLSEQAKLLAWLRKESLGSVD